MGRHRGARPPVHGNAILPIYLVTQLGFTPLHFGLFDGMYQGVTAVVRIAAGLIAERQQRYKQVTTAGYAVSAACKLGLWAAGTLWVAALGLLFLDRTGKGIRTAPRDALISLSSPPARLAEAFGVHRAIDTAGALLGRSPRSRCSGLCRAATTWCSSSASAWRWLVSGSWSHSFRT